MLSCLRIENGFTAIANVLFRWLICKPFTNWLKGGKVNIRLQTLSFSIIVVTLARPIREVRSRAPQAYAHTPKFNHRECMRSFLERNETADKRAWVQTLTHINIGQQTLVHAATTSWKWEYVFSENHTQPLTLRLLHSVSLSSTSPTYWQCENVKMSKYLWIRILFFTNILDICILQIIKSDVYWFYWKTCRAHNLSAFD